MKTSIKNKKGFWKHLSSGFLVTYFVCTVAIIIQIFFSLYSNSQLWKLGPLLGPVTNKYALFTSLSFTWLAIGGVLFFFSQNRYLTRSNIIFVITYFALSLLYLNILREKLNFGDIQDYSNAVLNLIQMEPFHQRYIYPPMWASFLSIFYHIGGQQAVYLTCFLLNSLSFLSFFPLIVLFLKRLGCSLACASILAFGAIFINVPILRNMTYVQVNLLLLDLILLSLLLYPKHKIISAITLCLGVHLKVFPLVFVILFLLNREWKWIWHFILVGIIIVFLTSYAYGFSYYFDFFRNLSSWKFFYYRDSSINSFIFSTAQVFKIPIEPVALIIKLFLIALTFYLGYSSVRNKSFVHSDDCFSDRIINGAIPLFFLFIIVAPTLWVHHISLLIPTVLAVSMTLRTNKQCAFFLVGYFLTFWLPTFDMYPWSYLRLVGWLIIYGLMASGIFYNRRGYWLETFNQKIDLFFGIISDERKEIGVKRRSQQGSGLK